MAENEELDIIELETDDGETVQLCVEKYFFYNGEEYVLLSDRCSASEEEAVSRYVMKVQPLEGEDGEEDMEEFVPVDDELTEKLIRVMETAFEEEQDEK